MKALVGAFNQEKAQVVIAQLRQLIVCSTKHAADHCQDTGYNDDMLKMWLKREKNRLAATKCRSIKIVVGAFNLLQVSVSLSAVTPDLSFQQMISNSISNRFLTDSDCSLLLVNVQRRYFSICLGVF